MKIVNRPAFLDTAEFKAWHERAMAARKALLESMKPPKTFNKNLWQEFKNDFLIPMGKCAYCEGRYAAGEFEDAEHYRPKGEVTYNERSSSIRATSGSPTNGTTCCCPVRNATARIQTAIRRRERKESPTPASCANSLSAGAASRSLRKKQKPGSKSCSLSSRCCSIRISTPRESTSHRTWTGGSRTKPSAAE